MPIITGSSTNAASFPGAKIQQTGELSGYNKTPHHKLPLHSAAQCYELPPKSRQALMPIANCFVTPSIKQGSSNLVDLWAKESEKSSEHMTINIIPSIQQVGKEYSVMANLLLPSVWSSSDVSSLQIGLATALATHFRIALSEVHVVTSIIPSGLVVEDGKEIQW